MSQTAAALASDSPKQPPAAASGNAASEDFVAAMRQAASGVTVVTATEETAEGERRWGVTVSAMTSVSAEPPLLLVCINGRSPVCAAIEASGSFCVNVLAENQQAVSDVFAGRFTTDSGDRFDCGDWTGGASGAPGLAGAAARFHCVLEASHAHGSHRIFIGRVIDAEAGDGRPLVYCDRSYARLALH